MLVKQVKKVVFPGFEECVYPKTSIFALSFPQLTCTLSPGGSPLGPDPGVSVWVWCGSVSDEAPWAAGSVVLEIGSEGAWRARRQEEPKVVLETGGPWAEEVLASVGHLQGRQHSPWALGLQRRGKYMTLRYDCLLRFADTIRLNIELIIGSDCGSFSKCSDLQARI